MIQQAAADMRANPDAFGRNVKTAMKGGRVAGNAFSHFNLARFASPAIHFLTNYTRW
jgi:hypothetical protein